ncbi:MAG: hypothetical protein HeimC3_07280 [Candidatus Heimdallarchaeota archaeon LC_3]|nr:MAG: hypothetical protein HeimC3_07280 [Candidatus Heimdallarchaeota archaeon LC_3]
MVLKLSNSPSDSEKLLDEMEAFKKRGKPFLVIGGVLFGSVFIVPPFLIFLSNFLPEFDDSLFLAFYLILFLGIIGLIMLAIGIYIYNKAWELETDSTEEESISTGNKINI